MNKIVTILAVMLLTAPAWSAGVTITASCDANIVTISYDNSEPNNVRAFALNITCTNAYGFYRDANIAIVDVNENHYQIYPGSVDINSTTGKVDANGSPFCYKSQYAPGTPGYNGTLLGPPDSNTTIEMGSLYVGAPNAPPKQGWLVKFSVNACCDINVAGNAIRVGAGNDGVVMEDPNEVVSVTYVGCTAYPPRPACWDFMYICHGDHDGNAGSTGSPPPQVDIWDFFAWKDSYLPSGHNWNDEWGTSEGQYNSCADYTQDGLIDIWDFFAWKDAYLDPSKIQDDCDTGSKSWPPSGYCGVP